MRATTPSLHISTYFLNIYLSALYYVDFLLEAKPMRFWPACYEFLCIAQLMLHRNILNLSISHRLKMAVAGRSLLRTGGLSNIERRD